MLPHFLILLLKLQVIISYQYLFHSNRPFPIELENRDIIYSNTSEYLIQQNFTLTKVIQCSVSNIGDGHCDDINNKESCEWDGGDCCSYSCEENCKKKKEAGSECIFECGVNGYDCKAADKCSKCLNGVCKSISDCYSNDKVILDSVENCRYNSISMGNKKSIDPFCGKDPNKTVIHFTQDPTFHYDGCGLPQSLCTKNPCCDVVAANNHTMSNCDNTPKTQIVWDEENKVLSTSTIGCLDFYRKCFQKNQVNRGQCCECSEGWTGTFCDVPVCKIPCVKGKCVGKDLCECDINYRGANCDEPICDKCEFGVCLAPNECECFYGYGGKGCDMPLKSPFCVNGVAKMTDKCDCFPGWKGDLCEIRDCINCANGICSDDGTCRCNPYYKHRNEISLVDNSTIFCSEIVSCKVYDEFCNSCNNTQCLSCIEGFTLQNNKCAPCSVLHNPKCNVCDISKCLSCDYPLDIFGNDCVSFGMIELSSNFYTVTEYEGKLDITLLRYYDAFRDVGVFYRLIKLNPKTNYLNFDLTKINNNFLNKVRNTYGYVIFTNGEKTKTISLTIYPDFFLEEKETKFILEIFNPFGGCYIGQISRAIIEIYDEIKFADLNSMSLTITGNVAIDNTNKIINLNKKDINNSFIDLTTLSFLMKDTTKNDGQDIILYQISFQERLRNLRFERDIIYEIRTQNYIGNGSNSYSARINFNKANVDLNLSSIVPGQNEKNEIKLKSLLCLQGIRYNYHSTIGFRTDPTISRLINDIEVDDYFVKTNSFSVEWNLYAKLNSIRTIKFVFYKPFKDLLDIYVNSKQLSVVEHSITKIEKCANYYSNGDCSRITFEEYTIDPNQEFFNVKIKLIHIRGLSYIAHYVVTNLGSIFEFSFKNSFACEMIQSPFKIEVS